MKKQIFIGMLCGLFALAAFENLMALPPSSGEIQMKERWLEAKFQCPLTTPQTGIEIIENYDPPRQNYAFNGKIRIGDKVYEEGLFCHATSNLKVTLPSPGKRFSAIVGVDNNKNNTFGTIAFSVEANGKVLCDTGLCRGSEPGVPVDVALDGATEFFLKVSNYDDDISYDQADWANGKIELEDGSVLKLGELVLLGEQTKTYEAEYPFSFVYDGKSSREFLQNWKCDIEETSLTETKKQKTFTFTDPEGLLEVKCVMVDYVDFPNVEWTLFFKNIGNAPTKVLEKVKSADFWLTPKIDCDITLHHAYGSVCSRQDYSPQTTVIKKEEQHRMSGTSGCASLVDWPYFSVEMAPTEGMIVVVGWPGQWDADLVRDAQGNMNVLSGQETVHIALEPGEEIRSPRMVVQPWRRANWIDAQNVWRAFMIRYCMPRDAQGVPYSSQIGGCSSHQFKEMAEADAASQIYFADRYIEEGIRLDYWWMDAGWYECNDSENFWQWQKTGSWWPEKTRFPNGLREVTDHLRKRDNRYNVVWFEPERVTPDTWLTINHPEWISGRENGGLLNLANPEVVDWMIEHFNGIIQKEGIELYRQDFNVAPLEGWQSWEKDLPNHQGYTENKHVSGYLRYWDSLLANNPGLRIDSCASGGRRNDFETMCRAVPLHRSDYIMEPVGQQSHSYGLFLWIPMFGSCTRALDDYSFRSCLIPGVNLLFDMRDTEVDYSNLRKNIKIWEECLTPYYLSDYYPLTTPSIEDDCWLGWQFNSPEKESGVIQMFRRANSPFFIQGGFLLHGLDEDASYELTDVDTQKTWTVSGEELMSKGVVLQFQDKPAALIVTYKKVK